MTNKPEVNITASEEIALLKKRISELENLEIKRDEVIRILNERDDTLKSIFRVAPAGMGMIRNRIFIETNPLLSKITGYSHEELLGKNTRILYTTHKEYESVGEEHYGQITKHGIGSSEIIWKRKDETLIDVLLLTTPIDQQNLQKGFTFTALDITEQKRAKAALQSSEERLKVIFEHAPDSIYLCDLKGHIIDGNIAAEKMIGQPKDELLGKSIFDLNFLNQKDLIKVSKMLEKNAMGLKTGPDKFKLNTKRGEKISIEITAYPIEIDKNKLVLGIARDLTERIKAEELNRENEQRMAFHVNQTPLAVIEWDLNFKVKRWNPAAEHIFGYSVAEAEGKHASFIIPESEMSHMNQIWMEITLLKGEAKKTNKNRHKNGNIIVCDWYNTPLMNEDGDIIAVASHALDVSERVRAEEIQKVIYNISNAVNSNDNLTKLISHIQKELTPIIDTTNFYIALYNKETDSLSLPFFADEKDQFTTFPPGKSLTAYVIKSRKTLLANHNTIQQLEQSGEIERIGSDSKIWLGVPLKIENEVIGVLAVQSYSDPDAYSEADMKMLEFVSDQISLSIHRKNTELGITRALERATESDRLKSSFLANMSHEIRTPMNGILGFANLLKNDKLSEKDRQQYIHIIEKSGNRMLGIINDLIDISKIESGITELILSDFNLNNALDYIYSFFKPEAEIKGLKLSYSKALVAESALIKSDSEKIYAILINLVKNAIKYTAVGEIDFGYSVANDFIRFKIKDTGIGIPEDKHEAIFNRFVQANLKLSSSFEGVGLGLAITKAYVELLGGKIWIESEHTKGSTFYFEIPYIKGEKMKNTEEQQISVNETVKSKLKILIAEDDVINQKLFSYILRDISDDLTITDNGAEAVKEYTERNDIDIILMDLKMPKMDGYTATRIIREKDKDIKIIALSAFAMETDRKKALENGFNDYVSKPIKKVELYKAIGKYFDI